MSRKLRAWTRAGAALDAYCRESGLAPGAPETPEYKRLYAKVSAAYDRLPARHRDPRDQDDDEE